MSAPVPAARPGQSRALSLAESVANVAVGYVLAVLAQLALFPILGLQATLVQSLKLGAAFTAISILRSYALRRLFEALRLRGGASPPLEGPSR